MSNPFLELIEFDDLDWQSAPVKIKDKWYRLYEASEEAQAKYRNVQMAGAQVTTEGEGKVTTTGVEGFADADSYLLSLCLYNADSKGNVPLLNDGRPNPDHLVPRDTVRRWPTRVTAPLIERLKFMSGIEKPDDAPTLRKRIAADSKRLKELEAANGQERAKNSSSATTESSA